MPNYEVLHGGVGNFTQGQVLTEKQAGPQIGRLLTLGAIRETEAEPTDPTAVGPYQPPQPVVNVTVQQPQPNDTSKAKKAE